MYKKSDVTFVVIGKNEEQNLEKCFKSIQKETFQIIYVDSNSEDNSLQVAKNNKIKKIIKFKSNFYTASLARVIGAEHINTKLIHFLDGDMKLESGWLDHAIKFINNKNHVVVVHGYKKEYKNNFKDYVIKKDKCDWQSDYLQGSYLIVTEKYFNAGGLDYRVPGEEERDLYVRLHEKGGQVWYHDRLMASHYDFKKRGFSYILASSVSAAIIIPLLKNVKSFSIRSYIYVYRRLLVTLLLDFLSILSLFLFDYRSFIIIFFLQMISLYYSFKINRIGYFIIWKSAFINLYRVFPLLKRKAKYKIELI